MGGFVMLLLNVNMKKFLKKDVEKKLIEYIERLAIAPDIIVMQECPYKRIKDIDFQNKYTIHCPSSFNKDKHEKWMTTVILTKNKVENNVETVEWKLINEPDHLEYVRNLRWIEIGNKNYSILGVHIPQDEDHDSLESLDSIRMLDSVIINTLNRMQKGKKVIIVGDMNANPEKSSPNNDRLDILKHISANQISMFDAWETCVAKENAYVINKKGKISCGNMRQPTFNGITHIDYALCSSNIIIAEISIDEQTLDFTDHCAIILKVEDEPPTDTNNS